MSTHIDLYDIPHIFYKRIIHTHYIYSRKVGHHSRGRPEGSLFNSYYTEVLGRAQLLSLNCSTLLFIRTVYCWVFSKEVSNTIFKVFGMTRPAIEPRSPGPLVNTFIRWQICIIYIYIYIYIVRYIYIFTLIDCFVVLQLFSVARHIRRFKMRSKPAQIYVRLRIMSIRRLVTYIILGIITHYILAFVCLYFALPDTRVLNSFEELCIMRMAAINSFVRVLNTPPGWGVYIVIHRFVSELFGDNIIFKQSKAHLSAHS